MNLSLDEEGVVRLVSARALAERLWAANPTHGEPEGTARAQVRALRDADAERSEERLATIARRRAGVARSEEGLRDELFADLGLGLDG